MQNRYVGDVGDYIKFSLLRKLSPGYHLGIAWWLYPNEENGDGRLLKYQHYETLDPDLYLKLQYLINTGKRSVLSLEQSNILQCVTFSRQAVEPIDINSVHDAHETWRRKWILDTINDLSNCNLIFFDPDNGLQPNGFRHRNKSGLCACGKYICADELKEFALGGKRCLIFYQHQPRQQLTDVIDAVRSKLCGESDFSTVDALRVMGRIFFILDAPNNIRQRAKDFAEIWATKIKTVVWNPH